jgi:hypothetical protein
MDWDELQTDIFDLVRDLDDDNSEKAKKIVDLIERRIDVPDSHVMQMEFQRREIIFLRDRIDKLRDELNAYQMQKSSDDADEIDDNEGRYDLGCV